MKSKFYYASPALAKVVGTAQQTRDEIVSRVWNYIKNNDLQDRQNKRMINCDWVLQPIFKMKQISMFEMTGLISNQISFKPWPRMKPVSMKRETTNSDRIVRSAKEKYTKRKIAAHARDVSEKAVIREFNSFLKTLQKRNCLMWSLHGLSIREVFAYDRAKLDDSSVSLAIMKLMRAVAEIRPGATELPMITHLKIDMHRCVLVNES